MLPLCIDYVLLLLNHSDPLMSSDLVSNV